MRYAFPFSAYRFVIHLNIHRPKGLFVTCNRKTLLNSLSMDISLALQPILDSHHPPRWIPDNVSVSLVTVPPVGQPQASDSLKLNRTSLTCVRTGSNCASQLYGRPGNLQANARYRMHFDWMLHFMTEMYASTLPCTNVVLSSTGELTPLSASPYH